MRIESLKDLIEALPITPRVLANLRETARLYSTHYSTMIEGNLLTQEQVAKVIAEDQHFPGRERDQQEVRGYYAALDEVERLAGSEARLSYGEEYSELARAFHGGRQDSRETDAIQAGTKCDPR